MSLITLISLNFVKFTILFAKSKNVWNIQKNHFNLKNMSYFGWFEMCQKFQLFQRHPFNLKYIKKPIHVSMIRVLFGKVIKFYIVSLLFIYIHDKSFLLCFISGNFIFRSPEISIFTGSVSPFPSFCCCPSSSSSMMLWSSWRSLIINNDRSDIPRFTQLL